MGDVEDEFLGRMDDRQEDHEGDHENEGEEEIDDDEGEDDIEDVHSKPESVDSNSDNGASMVRVFVCNDDGLKLVLPPPLPPTLEAKKLKVPTIVVHYKD